MPDFDRSLAFVIGINNYTNGITPLQNAVNDAVGLLELLRSKYRYQVWEYLDETATQQNLYQLLEVTLPEEVTADDRVLFYFAGHGIALNGGEGPEGYLIPQDAKLGDVQTYLPMTHLEECLSKLPCRHFLGILDCCFAGAFRWSSNKREILATKTVYKERYERFITDPAWQVITSAADNEKALDAFALNTERGSYGNNSPFGAALLEALEGKADFYPPATNGNSPGDGVITATELYLYLRNAVELFTQSHWQRQTPGIWSLKKHSKGEYIFLPPGHVLNLPLAPPLDESKNPYRGLESFEEEHSPLFFGRKALTKELYEFVNEQPLTVVLGASGTGKSSLVKAGLIPCLKKLQSQPNHQQWFILAPMRPGESPFKVLNNTLILSKIPVVELSNGNYQQALENLSVIINDWCQQNPNSKLLFVIDQLEELITLCRDEQERENFLNLLVFAVANYSSILRIILTIRSDFEPQFQDAHLQKYWQQARFIVPAMTREELREAIEEPASARVMYFEPPSLVEQLIDEVAQMPGALPLLSFTLSELYFKYLKSYREGLRDNRAITQQDYEELGGVVRSLTQRADREYKQLVKQDKAYAQTIRHVMLRMVAVGGGELARRRVPLSELEYQGGENERVQEVINYFTEARLLVKGQDADGNPYVEPAHDALVRGWQKLLTWKQNSEENLPLQRQLTPAAVEWKSIKNEEQLSGLEARTQPIINWLDSKLYTVENLFNQIPAYIVRLLWRYTKSMTLGVSQNQQQLREFSREKTVQFLWNANPYLDVLDKELKSDNNWLNQVEAEFVQQSVLQKRRNTSWGRRIAIAVILSLTGLLFTTLWQWRLSEIRRIEQTAIAAKGLLSNYPLQGMVTAISAYGQSRSPWFNFANHSFTQQIKDSLFSAVEISREKNLLKGHQGGVFSVVTSTDGEIIVSGGDDGTLRIWNRKGEPVGEPFKGHRGTVFSVAISGDGQTIVSGERYGNIRIWNRKGELLSKPIQAHQGAVQSVAISADGEKIVSGGTDGTVSIWNRKGEPVIKPFQSGHLIVRTVAMSADGETIVSGGVDGTLRVWNHKGKLLSESFSNDGNLVHSVAISANGETIVSGGKDSTVKIWNRKGKLLSKPFQGHQNSVRSVAISADGQIIISGGTDGSVRIWNRKGKLLSEPFQGHNGYVYSVAISTDGQTVFSGGQDGILRMWDFKGEPVGKPFEGHQGSVRSIAISSDGQRTIFSGSDDGTLRMWDFNGNPVGEPFEGHQYPVHSIAVSKDGQKIISGGEDGTVRIWNRKGQPVDEPFKGHDGPVYSVAISTDKQIIVSGGFDGTIRMWKPRRKPLGHPFKGNQGYVLSVAISTDGQTILSGGIDRNIIVWNLKGEPVGKPFEGHQGSVRSVVITIDGQIILSGSEDGTLRMWNPKGEPTGEPFKGHQGHVYSVAISTNGRTIVSGGADGTVRMWNRKGEQMGEPFKGHQGEVYSVAISTDGETIVSGGQDGTVRIWDIRTQAWLQVACERLRYHPVFKNPQTDDEKEANKTCKGYFR